jgi:hypothetical protein
VQSAAWGRNAGVADIRGRLDGVTGWLMIAAESLGWSGTVAVTPTRPTSCAHADL